VADALSPRARAQIAAEVIFLTHNEALHEVNLGWHPRAEAMLWVPRLQETKRSENGADNVRYRTGPRGRWWRSSASCWRRGCRGVLSATCFEVAGGRCPEAKVNPSCIVMPAKVHCCPGKVLDAGRKLICHVNYFVIPAQAGTQAVPKSATSATAGIPTPKTRWTYVIAACWRGTAWVPAFAGMTK
jgi:hypothetical protein